MQHTQWRMILGKLSRPTTSLFIIWCSLKRIHWLALIGPCLLHISCLYTFILYCIYNIIYIYILVYIVSYHAGVEFERLDPTTSTGPAGPAGPAGCREGIWSRGRGSQLGSPWSTSWILLRYILGWHCGGGYRGISGIEPRMELPLNFAMFLGGKISRFSLNWLKSTSFDAFAELFLLPLWWFWWFWWGYIISMCIWCFTSKQITVVVLSSNFSTLKGIRGHPWKTSWVVYLVALKSTPMGVFFIFIHPRLTKKNPGREWVVVFEMVKLHAECTLTSASLGHSKRWFQKPVWRIPGRLPSGSLW